MADFAEITANALRQAQWVIGPRHASRGFASGLHALVYPSGHWTVLQAGMPVLSGQEVEVTEAALRARDEAERLKVRR